MKFVENKGEQGLFEHILSVYKILPIELQNNYKNYFDKFQFWGTIDLENDNYTYFKMKANDIIQGLNDIKWLYERLNDYTSKLLLLGILSNWVNYSNIDLRNSIDNRFKHYFDLDLVPHCENEVLVDLGAYVGDTILDFVNTFGQDCYKKIYAYEITPSIFEILKNNTKDLNNIDYRLKAVKDKCGEIALLPNSNDVSSNRTQVGNDLECVTLDDDITEPITMLKMDIESDEPFALQGAKKHIKEDSPKLFISVYHNNAHLWELPRFIDSVNDNYEFYLRYYGGALYPTEIVLIGIPSKC